MTLNKDGSLDKGGGRFSDGDNFDGQGTSDFSNLNSVSTDEADITNETLIKASTDATVSSISSGNYTSPSYGTVPKDERNEFSSDQFSPDKTGWYSVSAISICTSPSSGDNLGGRIQNVTDGTTVDTFRQVVAQGSDTEEFSQISGVHKLTSGKSYEFQFADLDSSFEINNSFGYLTIRSAFREE